VKLELIFGKHLLIKVITIYDLEKYNTTSNLTFW
jgi:hypothetical protein